jgi:hypothetical protein
MNGSIEVVCNILKGVGPMTGKLNQLKPILRKLKIKSTFETFQDAADDTDAEKTRILLKVVGDSKFNDLLAFQSNGLILDSTGRVLVLPPYAFNNGVHANKHEIDRKDSDYVCYPINDGTLINLYFYNEKWRFSTSGGYDVGAYEWITEGMTYESAFTELLGKYSQFKPENLKKSHCYSFILKHHAFHPSTFLANRISFVQSVDMDAFNTDYAESAIGHDNPGFHEIMPIKRIKLHTVLYNSKNALSQTLAKLNGEDSQKLPPYHNLGVIFRAPFAKHGASSNIMIPSNLFKEIKHSVYHLPGINEQKTPAKRRQFILYKNAFNAVRISIFQTLFTNYSEGIAAVNSLVNTIALNVIARKINSNAPLKITGSYDAAALEELISIFSAEMVEFSARKDTALSIVTDFIKKPVNIPIFLRFH